MSPWSYRPLVDFSVLGRALEEGRPESAVTTLDKALALWRGPAYAEFQATPFGQAEGRRLEELRLSATEDRWAAALEQGRLTAAIRSSSGCSSTTPCESGCGACSCSPCIRVPSSFTVLPQSRSLYRFLTAVRAVRSGRRVAHYERERGFLLGVECATAPCREASGACSTLSPCGAIPPLPT